MLNELKPNQYQAVMTIFNTVPIKLGAYADLSCDQETLQTLVDHKSTGYTHQQREFPHLKQWLMASVDSVDEYEEAKQLGFRTYRYTRDEEMLEGEIRARTIRMECSASVVCCAVARATLRVKMWLPRQSSSVW